MAIKNDIAGWTPQLRDRKIELLASVIATMNTGLGPDLLGVCEVENRFVVDRLVDALNATLPAPRSYASCTPTLAMPAASTLRSSTTPPCSRFHCLSRSRFFHVVMRRHATREIVQVNFKTTTAAARTLAVFGNHWPSRSGGQFESAGYRAIAGETLSYFHQRVLEVHGRQYLCSRCATQTTNCSTLHLHLAPLSGSAPRDRR